eukprot:1517003-Amphidinium_carterae.1
MKKRRTTGHHEHSQYLSDSTLYWGQHDLLYALFRDTRTNQVQTSRRQGKGRLTPQSIALTSD